MKFYMKFETFAVSPRLVDRIDALPLDEQRKLCALYSFIRMRSGLGIHHSTLKEIAGKRYTAHLKQLLDWHLITCDKLAIFGNESKCFNYRVLEETAVKKSFRLSTLKAKDKSKILGKIQAHVKKCLDCLVVNPKVVESEDADTAYVQGVWLRRFELKEWNIKHGKDNERHRLFHSVIQAPKLVRKELRHKDRHKLAEFDVSACHLVFLLDFCKDSERQAYTQLLDSDIYASLAEESGLTREQMKEQALLFINGQSFNAFSTALRARCPVLVDSFARLRKQLNVAQTFQELETELMLFSFGKQCAEHNLFYVSTHDGWLGKSCEAEKTTSLVQSVFVDRFGYAPRIKATPIEDIDN